MECLGQNAGFSDEILRNEVRKIKGITAFTECICRQQIKRDGHLMTKGELKELKGHKLLLVLETSVLLRIKTHPPWAGQLTKCKCGELVSIPGL